METPWKVIVAFVGVFAAGAIFGGVFTLRASNKRFTDPAPKPSIDRSPLPQGNKMAPGPGPQTRGPFNPVTPTLMRQFTRRFNFTPDQRESVNKTLSRAGEDLYRLRQENFADTARVTERMYADIAAVLSPEQKVELEAMRRELQDKLQEGRKRMEGAAPEAGGREKQKGPRPPGEN